MRLVALEFLEGAQVGIAVAQADHESDLVEWRHGDALALPLQKNEWGKFDIVHARFVRSAKWTVEEAAGKWASV